MNLFIKVNPMRFGDYIAMLRMGKGLSQERLGKLAGVSGATISMLESGNRTDLKLSSFTGIARALGVDPVELFMAFNGQNPKMGVPKTEEEIIMQEALAKILDLKRTAQAHPEETDEKNPRKAASNPQ